MSYLPSSLIVGEVRHFAGVTAPASWLFTYGQAISRTTYAALFAVLNPSQGAVTISNATPGVLTKTAHGMLDGDTIYLTTSGGLPTGLSANTLYWVTKINADTFKVSTSISNFLAGTFVNTSSAGSGIHTLWRSPHGLGDGSTTFNVPDARGRGFAAPDAMGGTVAGRLSTALNATGGMTTVTAGGVGGEQSHTLAAGEQGATSATKGITAAADTVVLLATATAGAAHNTLAPSVLLNAIIYTGV